MYKKSKRAVILILVLIFGIFILSGTAEVKAEEYSTILTADRVDGIINIDGHADEASWANARSLGVKVFDGGIGDIDVVLRALYDKDNLYIHITWPDPTESVYKNLWTFNGTEWLKSEDEDRFAIFWNIDDSIRGFNIGGCAMLCHGDRMRTNAPDEKGDIWHWKATRTNPAGYADDKWMDDTIARGYTEEEKEAAHHTDSRTAGSYRANVNPNGSGPLYYEPSPRDARDATFIFQSEIDNGFN